MGPRKLLITTAKSVDALKPRETRYAVPDTAARTKVRRSRAAGEPGGGLVKTTGAGTAKKIHFNSGTWAGGAVELLPPDALEDAKTR